MPVKSIIYESRAGFRRAIVTRSCNQQTPWLVIFYDKGNEVGCISRRRLTDAQQVTRAFTEKVPSVPGDMRWKIDKGKWNPS